MDASPAPGRGGPPRRWNRRSILRGPADGKRGGEGGQRHSLRRNRRPGPPNGWFEEATESRESSFRVPRVGPGRANTRVPDARREAAAWPRGRMKHTGQGYVPPRGARGRTGPPEPVRGRLHEVSPRPPDTRRAGQPDPAGTGDRAPTTDSAMTSALHRRCRGTRSRDRPADTRCERESADGTLRLRGDPSRGGAPDQSGRRLDRIRVQRGAPGRHRR